MSKTRNPSLIPNDKLLLFYNLDSEPGTTGSFYGIGIGDILPGNPNSGLILSESKNPSVLLWSSSLKNVVKYEIVRNEYKVKTLDSVRFPEVFKKVLLDFTFPGFKNGDKILSTQVNVSTVLGYADKGEHTSMKWIWTYVLSMLGVLFFSGMLYWLLRNRRNSKGKVNQDTGGDYQSFIEKDLNSN